jgi:predicted transposase YbfD/YdcC
VTDPAAIWLLLGQGNGVPDKTKGFSHLFTRREAPLRGQSCMPVPADAAEAVIAEAEDIARRAAAREKAKASRGARREGKRRQREAGREREAAHRRERDRAERERLRAAADEARRALLKRAAALRAACGGSIRDCFAAMAEPRDPRGLRHSLPCVLTLVVMAMLHGKTKLAGITEWIRHAGQEDLAAAGARTGGDGFLVAPSPRTVTRLLGMLGAQALSDAVSCYLAAAVPAEPPAYPAAGAVLQPQLACDGKEVRGALLPGGTRLFILSAAADGIVLADREIPAKTNEIPEIGPMLRDLNGRFPLAGWILTADALHTQRDLAVLACEELLAQYVLTVKKNQPGLYAALDGLCWAGARRHVTRDKGHGRHETRRHLVMDAPDEIRALFPHAAQVARVVRTRTVTHWKGNGKTWTRVTETSSETVYLITSLTAREAGPEQIAAYARGHWGIENQVHLVRDVTLREDSSKVRAQSRPRNLATLRNITTGLIRQAGRSDIAATIREAEHDNDLLHALLRLTPDL